MLLIEFRVHDSSRTGFNDWPFMTVHQWGESPQGVWELEIHNKGRYMGKLIIVDDHFQLPMQNKEVLCVDDVTFWCFG